MSADPDPVAQVRAIWSAYARGGVDAMRAAVPPDVEWIPLEIGKRLPPDEFFDEWARRRAEEISVTVHGYERHGDCVLAHGSLRTFRQGGFYDIQPSWVYFFRAGRLARCAGYPTREDALHAIGAYDVD